MNKKLKADLTESLFQPEPLNLAETFYKIELFYLVRECFNRADVASVCEIGSFGPGVEEYNSEVYEVYELLSTYYKKQNRLNKQDILQVLASIFKKYFSPVTDYTLDAKVKRLANELYNEIHKLEKGNARKRLPSDPFSFGDFSFGITSEIEFKKIIE